MDVDEQLATEAGAVPPSPIEPRKLGSEVREETQRRLATRFGINSEFVRVPDLSKILGISSNAIYSQMRNRTFPVAHKRVGNVVLVKFIDFVDWYCAEGIPGCANLAPSPRSHPTLPAIPLFDVDVSAIAIDAQLIKRAETPKERSARIKQVVIAGMKAKRRS